MVGELIRSRAGINGRLFILLHDKMGNLKTVREVPNLILTEGLKLIGSALGVSGAVGPGAPFIALGEDSGPIASGDTTVSSEVASRVEGSYVLSAPNWYESSVFGSGVPTGGASVRQCGIYTSATGGVCFAKGSFAVVNKGTADSLTLAWTFSLA